MSRFLLQLGTLLASVAENASAAPAQPHRAAPRLRGWQPPQRLAAIARPASQSPKRAASVPAAKPVRNNDCTARRDVPVWSPENIRSRFRYLGFAPRWPGPEHGYDGSRRAR